MRNVLLMVTLLTIPLAAQEKLDGWNAARWGMTAAQVREAFPAGQVTDLVPPEIYAGEVRAPLKIDRVDVRGVAMSVRFLFASSASDAPLVGVNLESLTATGGAASEYATLVDALTEKYGASTGRRVAAGGTVQTTTWMLELTTIRLTHISLGGKDLLTLSYQRRRDDPNL
jgi:hypothetical protein